MTTRHRAAPPDCLIAIIPGAIADHVVDGQARLSFSMFLGSIGTPWEPLVVLGQTIAMLR